MIGHLLRTWRKQIPTMSCEAGCRECCEGYAPGMTRWEWRELRHPGKFSGGQILEACPFLGKQGCEIYARRPLTCRIFGTVSREELMAHDLAATLPVFCPRGRQPEDPWPLQAALKVQVPYQGFLNREIRATVADFRQWAATGTGTEAGATMPDKFEWLFYMLCTRDGQNNLRQLHGQGRPALTPGELGRLAAVIGGKDG